MKKPLLHSVTRALCRHTQGVPPRIVNRRKCLVFGAKKFWRLANDVVLRGFNWSIFAVFASKEVKNIVRLRFCLGYRVVFLARVALFGGGGLEGRLGRWSGSARDRRGSAGSTSLVTPWVL
jgi:hypothetical protein